MGDHTVMYVLAGLLCVLVISQGALVYPTRYTYPTAGLQSVNGSASNGGCTNSTTTSFTGVSLCLSGNSSLVDGAVPTLPSSLVGMSNWAAGLFTVNRNGEMSIEIGFELRRPAIERIELDLFNCPEWGIAAPNITVYDYRLFPATLPTPRRHATRLGSVTTLDSTSCDSITTVLIPLQQTVNLMTYYLEFTFDGAPSVQWVHLAEIRFFNSTPPTPTTTTMSTDTDSTPSTRHSSDTTTPPSTSPTTSHSSTPPTSLSSLLPPTPPNTTLSTPLSTQRTTTTLNNTDASTDMVGQPLPTAVIAALSVVIVILTLLVLTSIVVIVYIITKNKKEQQVSEVQKLKIAMIERGTELSDVRTQNEARGLTTSDPCKSMEIKHKKDIPPHEQHPVYSEIPGAYSEVHEDHNEGLYSEVRREECTRPAPHENQHSATTADLADLPHSTHLYSPVEHPYSCVQKPSPPPIPSKSSELFELRGEERGDTFREGAESGSNLSSSQHRVEPEDSTLYPQTDDSSLSSSLKLPGIVALSKLLCSVMLPNPDYEMTDEALNASKLLTQTENIYTEPDKQNAGNTATGSSSVSETVYSEPISPSLFTDDTFRVDTPDGTVSEELHPYAPIYSLPTNSKVNDKPLQVTSCNIQVIHELGKGLFGKVILAETLGLSPKDLRVSKTDNDKSKSMLVAVKTLKSGAPSTTKEAFEKEVNFMSRLNDRNIIRILGVCYEDTPFIMMEYMENGDLNRYLQKFKELSTTDSEPQGQITIGTLIHMTTQIASAMKYLASHNFVHRDLATRNCLVGSNYLVKISDFGMSRNLYESHYYLVQGRCLLPIRWMATECYYGKFSQKSDVWAFGVTMWEIFILAKEQPYSSMKDQELINDALKGKSRTPLKKPEACPPEVFAIMMKCWEHDSSQRPTFEELFEKLSALSNNS